MFFFLTCHKTHTSCHVCCNGIASGKFFGFLFFLLCTFFLQLGLGLLEFWDGLLDILYLSLMFAKIIVNTISSLKYKNIDQIYELFNKFKK